MSNVATMEQLNQMYLYMQSMRAWSTQEQQRYMQWYKMQYNRLLQSTSHRTSAASNTAAAYMKSIDAKLIVDKTTSDVSDVPKQTDPTTSKQVVESGPKVVTSTSDPQTRKPESDFTHKNSPNLTDRNSMSRGPMDYQINHGPMLRPPINQNMPHAPPIHSGPMGARMNVSMRPGVPMAANIHPSRPPMAHHIPSTGPIDGSSMHHVQMHPGRPMDHTMRPPGPLDGPQMRPNHPIDNMMRFSNNRRPNIHPDHRADFKFVSYIIDDVIIIYIFVNFAAS